MVESEEGVHSERTALVLYGSETGNSQDAAEDIGRVVQRLHFVTRVCEMDQVDLVCPPLFLAPKAYLLMTVAIEISLEAHDSYLCSWDYWARRIPQKLEDIVEKSPEKAFASRLSGSRELHHIWARR